MGIARVPDARVERLAEMYKPKKKTPATVEYVDVPGVAKGEGAALVDLPALRGRGRPRARGARLRVRHDAASRRLRRSHARRADARAGADPRRPGRGGAAPGEARLQHQEAEPRGGRGGARALPQDEGRPGGGEAAAGAGALRRGAAPPAELLVPHREADPAGGERGRGPDEERGRAPRVVRARRPLPTRPGARCARSRPPSRPRSRSSRRRTRGPSARTSAWKSRGSTA